MEAGDILELMAAANFFQLDGLLHYCEYRCADLIDLDTIVSYYIHAKVGILWAYFRAKRILASCREVENNVLETHKIIILWLCVCLCVS